MEEKKAWTLLVGRVRVPVTEAVYRAYYQERERERYLNKRARGRELSAQALEDKGYPLDAHAKPKPSAEEAHIKEAEGRDLDQALALLTPESRERLWALVLGETTERAMAKSLGISPATVHRRKVRALATLRQALGKAFPEDEAKGPFFP